MNWDNEIWMTVIAMVGSGVAYIVKLIQKKFEAKEGVIVKLHDDIKTLQYEKINLSVLVARMQERLMKHTAKSKKRKNGHE